MRYPAKLLLAVALLFGAASVVLARSPLGVFGRSTYTAGQVDIVKTELLANGTVKISFKTPIESAAHCPGANAKTTKDGIVLEFVRAAYNKSPKVTYPLDRENERATPYLLVDAKEKPVFLKSKKKLVRIHPPKKP